MWLESRREQIEMSRRCDGKRSYRWMKQATKQAKLATERAGKLIIAYECYDCGAWHIGHADLSQQIAHGWVKPNLAPQ
jgi:hypothetical protein